MQPPSNPPPDDPPPDGDAPDQEEIIIGPRPAKLEPPKATGVPLDSRPLLSPAPKPASYPPAPRAAAPATPSPASARATPPAMAKPPIVKPKVQPAPKRRLDVSKPKLAGAGVILVSLGLPIYLALASHTFRDAGVGAFVAMFFGLLSLITANIRLLLSRKEPKALGLAAAAAGLGAAAILIAAVFAIWMHSDAENVANSDVALEYGMREFLIGEAQHNGRVAALFGLMGIPGFLIGTLDVAMVLGARRIAESQAKLKKEQSEPIGPVWIALVAPALAFVVGFFSDFYAIFLSVNTAPNPREARLVAIRTAADQGEWKAACEDLEHVLVPDFVPERIMDEKLPNRVELAHRCLTRKIDDLPPGAACAAAADRLLDLEIVRVAKAKDRVHDACKGR